MSVRRPGAPWQPAPYVVDDRPCQLYRIWVWDPYTNYTTKRLGYLGESVRAPITRLLEHAYEKSFADTICDISVDDRVYAGKDAVQAAEAEAIRAEMPLYNYEHNLDNPDRIPPWEADEQREQRRAAGWVQPTGPRPASRPASRRPVSPRPLGRPRRRRAFRLRLSRWQLVPAVWLLFTVALWWMARDVWAGWDGPRNAAVGSALVLGGVGWAARPKRRRRRRRSRW